MADVFDISQTPVSRNVFYEYNYLEVSVRRDWQSRHSCVAMCVVGAARDLQENNNAFLDNVITDDETRLHHCTSRDKSRFNDIETSFITISEEVQSHSICKEINGKQFSGMDSFLNIWAGIDYQCYSIMWNPGQT